MTRDEIDSHLRKVFADMFDRDPCSFDYGTTPDTIVGWDSLVHIKLISAIEERMDYVIAPEDQIDMITFELIGDILEERLDT